jgi:hypothetical protein
MIKVEDPQYRAPDLISTEHCTEVKEPWKFEII